MNKKSLANIRKEFKVGSFVLPVKEIYSIYLKKDNGEIIMQGSKPLELMEVEARELYLSNFKKALTGSIDSKIFELSFKDKGHDRTQDILQQALNNEISITEMASKVVDKIKHNFNYDTDIVMNFIKTEYYTKNNIPDSSYLDTMEFILCTINKVEVPKKVLKFDYSGMEFKTNSALDVTVNLDNPLDAFMYPSFDDEGYTDTDKIIYYSHKANNFNSIFVNNVLECRIKPTAAEEKESFKSIIQNVTENKIAPKTLQNIYEDVNEKIENDTKETKLNMDDIGEILENNIISTGPLKSAFEEICGGDYKFKAKNIVPDFRSKSIKIENENIDITVMPGHLKNIKQIRDKEGRKCLNIILSENITIDGLDIETED